MISGIVTVCALETIGEFCNIIIFLGVYLNEIHAGLPVQRSPGLDASRAIPQGFFFAYMIIRAIIDLDLLCNHLALVLFLSGLGAAQLNYFYACSAQGMRPVYWAFSLGDASGDFVQKI